MGKHSKLKSSGRWVRGNQQSPAEQFMNMLDCSFPCNHLTKLDRMGTLVLLCRTRLAVDVMIPMRLSSGAAALGHIPHHVCNLGWNLFALSSLFV